MNKISLTLKITIAFIVVSIITLTFLYFIFYNLFKENILASEKEKAIVIAKTIEPIIAMNSYLNLHSEIRSISEQTMKQHLISHLEIIIDAKVVFSSNVDKEKKYLVINYPIFDPILKNEIGNMNIHYKLDDFYKTFDDVKDEILKYLFLLMLIFLLFAFVTRYLLSPLAAIAKKVTDYKLGSEIEFSTIRTEPETEAIIFAFKKMLSNIREYTILLERYKYAVDESAIVSTTNINGVITYANDEFCRTSGYSRDELVNNTHNIVRHPDMPAATFKSLWETLKRKEVWKGVVKNKSKTGQAYYVKATIVPIFDENGNTVEYIAIRHDITKIIKQQEQIARQTTDLITGLPNRVKLEEDLKGIETPKFALVSLDNFQIIKDYYGYEMGNETLKETAKILQEFLQNRDIKMYKLSSGEFGMLVGDNINISIFNDICSGVLQKIEDSIINLNNETFNIHATAGLTYSKKNSVSNASLALQHAKDTHKNSLVFEDTKNLIHYYENNITWTKKLKEALSQDRIVVFTQPIVNAKTLETDKYECLVRMIDVDGKIISPFHFLDIAKKSKLYHALTRRVIASSFKVFSKLRNKSFSINLSVEDLINKDTMEFLKEQIAEYNIASQLVLEIVESEGIDNFNDIVPLIAEMKALGCKISIDDFGTGYSNFAYLMELNVDYIKIDGSLIKSIDHDPNSQVISQTIIDFAKRLELKTVAEFIHNDAVMKYMQSMDIDYLQGFHLGEPVSIDTLIN